MKRGLSNLFKCYEVRFRVSFLYCRSYHNLMVYRMLLGRLCLFIYGAAKYAVLNLNAFSKSRICVTQLIPTALGLALGASIVIDRPLAANVAASENAVKTPTITTI